MNSQCEVIRDLLPLYVDDACSDASSQMVRRHLSECAECAETFQKMKPEKYEADLVLEKESVLTHHAKAQKRTALIAGASIAGILCIPVIVCLIVNLATGHGLDWFFIVAASLLVLASLTVVPLMATGKKLLWTLLAFTASLLLLLFTCAAYTQGRWFPMTASAVLLGLSVLFAPYLAHTLPLPEFWKRNKLLFAFILDTLLLAVMLCCIGLYNGSAAYWDVMPPIALFNAGFVWVLFLLCRYLRANGLIRGGIAAMLCGTYYFSCNNIINSILGEALPWPRLGIGPGLYATIDGNIKWLVLLAGLIGGLLCILKGLARRHR